MEEEEEEEVEEEERRNRLIQILQTEIEIWTDRQTHRRTDR